MQLGSVPEGINENINQAPQLKQVHPSPRLVLES